MESRFSAIKTAFANAKPAKGMSDKELSGATCTVLTHGILTCDNAKQLKTELVAFCLFMLQ